MERSQRPSSRSASAVPPAAFVQRGLPASSVARAAPRQAPAGPGVQRAQAGKPRLVADERYFGLEARELRSGLERSIARLARLPAGEQRVDVHGLSEDFRLGDAAAAALLRAFVAGGLLEPDSGGQIRATALFHDYASTRIIAPMSRERAKALLAKMRELATRINVDWTRNPYRIRMIAVSGSYMSRRKHLPDLPVSVVLQRRPLVRVPRWKRPLSKAEAVRQIVEALHQQSSFITVRLVPNRDAVQRPFLLVFQCGDEVIGDSVQTWEKLRDWGASISRRLGGK